MSAPLLVAVLALQYPAHSDFPWARDVGADALSRPDVVAIVTAEGGDKRQLRQTLVRGAPGSEVMVAGPSAWLRTIEAKAVAGKGVKSGEKLRLVSIYPERWQAPGQLLAEPPPDRLAIRKGQRYLILGFAPKKERFSFPPQFSADVLSRSPNAGERPIFATESKNEVATVMAFPTQESALPKEIDAEAIRRAVIATLSPKEDDSYRRVVDFLRRSGPPMKRHETPGKNELSWPLYTPEGAETRALRAALPGASDYQKSKIWELMVEWRARGCIAGYARAIERLADEPDIYQPNSSDSMIERLDRDLYELGEAPTYSAQKWLDLTVRSSNPTVAMFFLYNFGAILDAGQQLQLAGRLLDKDSRVRAFVAYKLSLINRDQEHRPWLIGFAPRDEGYVKYWIDFYKVKPPSESP